MMAWASIVFGCLSAALWLWSSVVPMPPQVWTLARTGGGGPSPDLDKLVTGLRRQSRLNSAAASCAAAAVAFQVFHVAP
jgi:hypothetical protein